MAIAFIASATLSASPSSAQSKSPQPYLPPRPAPPEASAAPPTAATAGQPEKPVLWGALAYTSDGLYAGSSRHAVKDDATAAILKKCTGFARGKCEIVSIRGEQCVGLASYVAVRGRTRYQLSYTAGAVTVAEAQAAAVALCKRDARTLGQCKPRAVLCADGRS